MAFKGKHKNCVWLHINYCENCANHYLSCCTAIKYTFHIFNSKAEVLKQCSIVGQHRTKNVNLNSFFVKANLSFANFHKREGIWKKIPENKMHEMPLMPSLQVPCQLCPQVNFPHFQNAELQSGCNTHIKKILQAI